MKLENSANVMASPTYEATFVAARQSGGWIGLAALLLLYSVLWLVLVPYGGLSHDAQGYAIEALVKLRPDVYANDLFLQFRSQDEFTIFPGLYAALIDVMGLEAAAAASVFVCQVLWYLAAFLLLRQLAGTNLALFGIALLLTLSNSYGGFGVFHLAEPFMTARLPAEVLSLAGLWLLLREKTLLAAVVLLFGIAMHPLIAFPATLLAGCVWVARRFSPRWVPVLLASGVVAAVAGSFLLGGENPFMDGRWLAVTAFRSTFLFVDLWRASDWSNTLLSLLTLGLGAIAVPGKDTRLTAGCALGLAVAGLALAAISSLWLHLEVLIQGQPWRWFWPARFLAIGLLPAVAWALWRHSTTGRSAALLLGAAWLFITPISARSNLIQMLPALLGLIACGLWLARSRVSADLERTVQIGTWVMVAAVFVSSIVTMSLAWELMDEEDSLFAGARGSQLLNMLQFLTPAAILALLGCAAARLFWTPLRGALVAGTGIVLAILLGPAALNEWMNRPFSGEAHAAFADWRAKIPSESEVLWYDNLRETWFLLERRAYLTRSQSGGIVFSEKLADEIVRRALVLEPYIDKNFWFISVADDEMEPYSLDPEILTSICRDPELGFVVSEDDIGLAIASREWPAPGERLYLYTCADFRSGAGG